MADWALRDWLAEDDCSWRGKQTDIQRKKNVLKKWKL